MICSDDVETSEIYQEDCAYLTSFDLDNSNLTSTPASCVLDSTSYMSPDNTMEIFHPYFFSAKYQRHSSDTYIYI